MISGFVGVHVWLMFPMLLSCPQFKLVTHLILVFPNVGKILNSKKHDSTKQNPAMITGRPRHHLTIICVRAKLNLILCYLQNCETKRKKPGWICLLLSTSLKRNAFFPICKPVVTRSTLLDCNIFSILLFSFFFLFFFSFLFWIYGKLKYQEIYQTLTWISQSLISFHSMHRATSPNDFMASLHCPMYHFSMQTPSFHSGKWSVFFLFTSLEQFLKAIFNFFIIKRWNNSFDSLQKIIFA